MGFKPPVVSAVAGGFRLLSYGNGTAYEIERLGSGGHVTFVQGEDADALRDALCATTDERTDADVLREWYYAPA
jgi:hypothetical protein